PAQPLYPTPPPPPFPTRRSSDLLADDPLLDADVDERALAADALAVDDVELGLLERRGDLVLDHLAAGAVADRVGAVLQRLDAPQDWNGTRLTPVTRSSRMPSCAC